GHVVAVTVNIRPYLYSFADDAFYREPSPIDKRINIFNVERPGRRALRKVGNFCWSVHSRAHPNIGLCERIKRTSHELFPIEKFTYWQQWPGSYTATCIAIYVWIVPQSRIVSHFYRVGERVRAVSPRGSKGSRQCLRGSPSS